MFINEYHVTSHVNNCTQHIRSDRLTWEGFIVLVLISLGDENDHPTFSIWMIIIYSKISDEKKLPNSHNFSSTKVFFEPNSVLNVT